MPKTAKIPPRPIQFTASGLVKCRVCSCTEERACNPPCSWVEADLCSTCKQAIDALRSWKEAADRPSLAALIREFKAPAPPVAPPRFRLQKAG